MTLSQRLVDNKKNLAVPSHMYCSEGKKDKGPNDSEPLFCELSCLEKKMTWV